MVAGGRYDTVCTLPVPLMLPAVGQVRACARELIGKTSCVLAMADNARSVK